MLNDTNKEQAAEHCFLTEKRLLTLKEVSDYTGLGYNNARRMVELSGSARHFGRRVLCDRLALDAYLDSVG